jgi:hypothetical protein
VQRREVAGEVRHDAEEHEQLGATVDRGGQRVVVDGRFQRRRQRHAPSVSSCVIEQ